MRRENTELRKYWEHHITQWSGSGKSQTEYCKEHQLAIKSFGYWKRKLSAGNSSQFVEIKNQSTSHPLSYIELISADGILFRFREDIPEAYLKNIVAVLRG